MNNRLFLIFKRNLHDRKLPSVITSKLSKNNKLLGTQSPLKANHSKTTKKNILDINEDNNEFSNEDLSRTDIINKKENTLD